MAEVIAAVATGNSRSAIGIIRVSGGGTLCVIDRVFRTKSGAPMSKARPRLLISGELLDKNGRVIDLCMCTVSFAPSSYTGEDTAELHCHGSPAVLREAMESLFAAGARQALPGEFTKRAFLNGRLDLSRSEAVIDLIDAQTAAAARSAVSRLGGALSRRVEALYSLLIDVSSHFHAVLDYPDEDIEPFELERYAGALSDAECELMRLAATYERGKTLRDGLPAAIIGKPNAGKSSLLNALLGYDRAIVTDIPGTTRDTVEEKAVIGGVLLRLIDTAGLRKPGDEAEALGVARALRAAEEAALVVAVFDGSLPLTEEDRSAAETALSAACSVAVINKSDLPAVTDERCLPAGFSDIVRVSAKSGDGLYELSERIARAAAGLMPTDFDGGEILTSTRQLDAVTRAAAHIASARGALSSGGTADIVLTEAEGAMLALGELSGKTVTEDVTSRIFDRFCVGK